MIAGTNGVTIPNSASYFALAPAAPKQTAVTPSYAQTAVQGSGTLSGLEKGITEQFQSVQRNVPSVDLTLNSPYNAIKAQDTAARIEKRINSTPIDSKLRFGGRYVQEQGRLYNQVYSRLLDLRNNAGRLQSGAAYNTKTAKSSDSAVATASAGPNSASGAYNITVTRLARGDLLASATGIDPAAALGLSGSFKINGWLTDVAAGDSLADIADKINYGEDANHNGKLDYPADLNGNSTLETLSAPAVWTGKQYLPSFYWNENAVGRGSLSPNEDTNGNETLDGGSSQTGARALVSGGQLVLESFDGGNVDLRIEDPSGVLEAIGFIYRDPASAQTETNRSNDQSLAAQTAQYSVNGVAGESSANTVTLGTDGLTLSFTGTGSATVTVSNAAALPLNSIGAFGGSFNSALDLLNNTMLGAGALSDNVRLQDIYTDTVRSFYGAPPSGAGGYSSVADLGIGAASSPSGIPQTTLDQLPGIQAEQPGLPGTGTLSYITDTKHVKVDAPSDFKMSVDAARLEKELGKNSGGVKEMLSLAASRLQQTLDRHLQPVYGTIRFQQGVIAYYSKNQAEAGKLAAYAAQGPAKAAAVGKSQSLLAPVAQASASVNVTA